MTQCTKVRDTELVRFMTNFDLISRSVANIITKFRV